VSTTSVIGDYRQTYVANSNRQGYLEPSVVVVSARCQRS